MDAEQRDLLLSMAFVYLSCSRERRALPLLLLVHEALPADEDALRALAHAYTAVGRGDRALTVLDRFAETERGPDEVVLLLRSRALHQQNRLAEAQACFARLHPQDGRRLTVESAA